MDLSVNWITGDKTSFLFSYMSQIVEKAKLVYRKRLFIQSKRTHQVKNELNQTKPTFGHITATLACWSSGMILA